MKHCIYAFTTLVSCALIASPVSAAFLRVDPSGGGDYLTVQAAMLVAAPGDSIAVRAGLNTVTNVQVKEAVLLLGGWNAAFTGRVPGSSHLVTSGNNCILRLSSGQTTATLIDGFELSGANQSAIWLTGSSATITNNDFHDNYAADGGAVHCEYGASPVIANNHIHHNTANYGGGLRGHFGSGNSPTIRNNVIEYNSAFDTGGGIAVNNGSPVIEDNIVRFNQTNGAGGGIHVWHAGGGTVELRRNLIVFNVGGKGGGIGISGGHPIIENNTLWANNASQGGAISNEESTIPEPGIAQISHNILGGSPVGAGVQCLNQTAIALSCNDVFGNAAGHYINCPPPVGDIHVDPSFCDPYKYDFRLMSNSPCAPQGVCGLIGAFGIGCGAVSIEPTTWAHIKAAYR